jgi:hypothetical protein
MISAIAAGSRMKGNARGALLLRGEGASLSSPAKAGDPVFQRRRD